MIISLVSIEIKENNEDVDSYFQYTFAEEEFVMTELVILVPILFTSCHLSPRAPATPFPEEFNQRLVNPVYT